MYWQGAWPAPAAGSPVAGLLHLGASAANPNFGRALDNQHGEKLAWPRANERKSSSRNPLRTMPWRRISDSASDRIAADSACRLTGKPRHSTRRMTMPKRRDWGPRIYWQGAW